MPYLRSLSLVLASLLLSGCAGWPGESAPRVTPLGRDDFAARIDALETTLVSRCTAQREQWREQSADRRRLTADVREIGNLLRGFRADLADLGNQDTPPAVEPACAPDLGELANKTILGRSEWVGFPQIGTYMKARVDSGANTSSLSATEITPFERDGEDWIRFKLALTDDDSVIEAVRDEWIETAVVRRVRIIQAAGEESRPVVRLLMTLGPIRQSVEFTLNDRTDLSHPVLLGRRFLMDIAIIDVAQRYRHARPEFPEAIQDPASDRDDEQP